MIADRRAGAGASHAPRDRYELEEEAHPCLPRMFRSALAALFVVPARSNGCKGWNGAGKPNDLVEWTVIYHGA